jgi:hypothetical protein
VQDLIQIQTVPCVNVSQDHVQTTQKFAGQPVHISVGPGAVVNVPVLWARKREWGGLTHPSVLEMVAPQLVPCDSEEGRKFLAAQKAAKALADAEREQEAPKAQDAPKAAQKGSKTPSQGSLSEG